MAGNIADLRSPIGLLSGNGDFPLEFARRANAQGLEVVAVGYRGETSPELKELSNSFHLIRIGQLAKAIKIFKANHVQQICILGGIKRFKLFGGVRLDWRAVRTIARAKSFHDDALLRSIAYEFESCGFEIIAASTLLGDFLARTGQMTRAALSIQQQSDAKIGWKAAKRLGELDIGQTVVVHNGLVVAVEASEGTDGVIQRAGSLNANGAVVVKVAKPQQDPRLDLPSVGPETIEAMSKAGLSALVLEHESAQILRPQYFVELANKLGIAVEVFSELD